MPADGAKGAFLHLGCHLDPLCLAVFSLCDSERGGESSGAGRAGVLDGPMTVFVGIGWGFETKIVRRDDLS